MYHHFPHSCGYHHSFHPPLPAMSFACIIHGGILNSHLFINENRLERRIASESAFGWERHSLSRSLANCLTHCLAISLTLKLPHYLTLSQTASLVHYFTVSFSTYLMHFPPHYLTLYSIVSIALSPPMISLYILTFYLTATFSYSSLPHPLPHYLSSSLSNRVKRWINIF